MTASLDRHAIVTVTPRRPRGKRSEPKRSVGGSKRRRSERLAKRGKSSKSVAPSATRSASMPT